MTSRSCPRCGGALRGSRRRRYCSEACRQAAYRNRQRELPARQLPPGAAGETLADRARTLAVAATALADHLDRRRIDAPGGAPARLTTTVAGFRPLVDDLVTSAVLSDRAAGARWEALGEALGLSGETARLRYGRSHPNRGRERESDQRDDPGDRESDRRQDPGDRESERGSEPD